MDREIREFIDSIGASEPNRSEKNYDLFRTVFKRSNYFRLNSKFLIIKVSRIEKPFFGVSKDILDILDDMNIGNYFLVLLVSNSEGWIYSKSEIKTNINSSVWKASEKDNNYKIHYATLRDYNLFASPLEFLNILGAKK